METCVRGFSFMPEDKVEEKSLQYVEELELERTWKNSRRERLKQQEKRIWDEFVKEQDIVTSVCRDDPYQFVNEIPEDRLEEFLDSELKKMRKASPDYDDETNNVNHLGSSELAQLDTENQRTVMFASEDQDECDMFHIFDDEDVSGPEAEVMNESVSPVTVRERADDTERELSPVAAPHAPDSEKSVKSSENVVGMIENSIYCAKVNDLRMKINDELLAIIMSLECQNVMAMDPEDLQKTRKRSTEFCMRFNRIRMYQLQRQLHDVNRHNVALPFAKHTHFQSQMVRITSLHQNLLQALQVFHKSLERGAWLRESVVTLRALLMALRDAGAVARAAQPPPALSAARGLCHDDIEASADKLEKAIDEYATKISSLLKTSENVSPALSKKGVGKKKRRLSKSVYKADGVEGRLSMYSLDTLRINLPKSCSSKGYQSSGTSKKRGKVLVSSGKSSPQPKSRRKSPRPRRPLMRAPQGAARRRAPRDADIHTMVEAVAADTCTSSHISREQSPQMSSHFGTPRRRSRDQTPRTPRTPHSAHTSHSKESPKPTPRNLGLRTQSPKAKHRRNSPKISPNQRSIKVALSSIASETNELHEQISPIQISPTPVAPKLVEGKISKKDVKKKEVKKIGKKDEKKLEKKENPPNLIEEYVRIEEQQKEATKEVIKAVESPKKTPRKQEEAVQSRADREQERYERDSNNTPPCSDRKNGGDKAKVSDSYYNCSRYST